MSKVWCHGGCNTEKLDCCGSLDMAKHSPTAKREETTLLGSVDSQGLECQDLSFSCEVKLALTPGKMELGF